MWYNNYQVGERRFNFVIWKDYNCGKWQTLGELFTSSFNNAETFQINTALSQIENDTADDIWGETKKFMKSLTTQQNLGGSTKALSVVMTQTGNTMDVFGRLCSFEDKLQKDFFKYKGVRNWGYYILFQTR